VEDKKNKKQKQKENYS